MDETTDNLPSVDTEHGIKVIYDNGDTKRINFGTLDEAQSAEEDWAKELPTATVTRIHRPIQRGAWEDVPTKPKKW